MEWIIKESPAALPRARVPIRDLAVNGMVAANQIHVEGVLAYDLHKLYDVVTVSEMNRYLDHL